MTDQELATLRAAVRVKLGHALDADGYTTLCNGLPQRHGVVLSLTDTADFILRRFILGEGETAILARVAPTRDIDRE